MSLKPSFDNIGDWLAAKPAGLSVETILAKSPGEVNRIRQKLSDEGLCGYVGGAR